MGKDIYKDRKILEVASYILPKRKSKIVDFNYGLLDFGGPGMQGSITQVR
jgi:hypothetical protein